MIHNPHDHLFKAVLSVPGTAKALLREQLPPEFVALFADDEPEAIEGTFIDDTGEEVRTDRLYRVRTKDGEPIYVYVLLEHKSYSDPWVALQLLRYLTRVYVHLAQLHRPGSMPPVVPLVVYHGAEPWRAARRFSGLLAVGDAVKPLVLDFPYVLLDLGATPRGRLSQNDQLDLGLQELKYALRPKEQEAVVRGIVVSLLAYEGEALAGVRDVAILYLLEFYSREAVLKMLDDELPPGFEGAKRFLEEVARREAVAEGEAKGEAKALLKFLTKRFGPLPEEAQQRVFGATVEELELWIDRVQAAATLADVFKTHH